MLSAYLLGGLITAACDVVLKTVGSVLSGMGIDTSALRPEWRVKLDGDSVRLLSVSSGSPGSGSIPVLSAHTPVPELVDGLDSGSSGPEGPCGFESRRGYLKINGLAYDSP